MERVSLYIDGGNFYHLVLKKLGIKEADFDFDGFANFLANERTYAERCKRYYIGTVREKEGDIKSKQSMSLQTSLFTRLIASKWEVKTSKLRERREKLSVDKRIEEYDKLKKTGVQEIHYTRQREKGIDVKIVTDLFIGAIDNKYDTAIVVSSDTDLVPAIDSIRHRLKKKVEYVGFSIPDKKDSSNSTTPVIAMISRTDIQRTLVEADLKPFIIPKMFPNE